MFFAFLVVNTDSCPKRCTAGVRVRGVKTENQRIRLLRARDCTLKGITLTNGAFLVEGQAEASTLPEAPSLGLTVRHLDIDHGYLELQHCRGLTCQAVRITHPVGDAVRTNQLFSSPLEGFPSSEQGTGTAFRECRSLALTPRFSGAALRLERGANRFSGFHFLAKPHATRGTKVLAAAKGRQILPG